MLTCVCAGNLKCSGRMWTRILLVDNSDVKGGQNAEAKTKAEAKTLRPRPRPPEPQGRGRGQVFEAEATCRYFC